ncbi:hypothetical protein EVAR_88325_1 [Eumeta japonica]|uniref:Uncharacterized protein n=1 Tax=Eumeta variegata TaxID=151549 RepID=A0A4C1VMB2_EUMVA|nr:hypothetical protein EVAR_88325_1 [Eumeta japonica]
MGWRAQSRSGSGSESKAKLEPKSRTGLESKMSVGTFRSRRRSVCYFIVAHLKTDELHFTRKCHWKVSGYWEGLVEFKIDSTGLEKCGDVDKVVLGYAEALGHMEVRFSGTQSQGP